MLLKTKTAPDERQSRSNFGVGAHSTVPWQRAELSVRPTSSLEISRLASNGRTAWEQTRALSTAVWPRLNEDPRPNAEVPSASNGARGLLSNAEATEDFP